MTGKQAYQDTYQGEPAVWLKFGRYEAVLLPEVGANLIAFRDVERGFALLHEPTQDEMESFKARPFIHGIPVLYPPNRFEDGKFPWNGRTLEFPVNEPATGNHLHGFVHSETWTVEDFGATATESYVVASLRVNEQSEVYKYLPFRFTLRLRYAISDLGLEQQFTVINEGDEALPCLFAFHTAINAPFVPGNSAKDYRLKLTIGERWHLNERMLPTGEFQPLTANEQLMKGEGVYPFFESLDNHYTVAPQNGRNRMELTDTKAGLTLVYDAGTSYKQWMIWNNGATEGFFCPEPQVSLVNAPNTKLPADEIGLFSLAPGEIWQERARIYVK
ncbi:aldose 1-epimerase [Paenibacillus lycopersici]|uniref:Aldose 1-epimerase n=1 Tax=Paenibacillus lycopersici TaxID=2704462 RepID=A0A6C0G6Z5_9BACL|nr:aldose 1-epimerase [Paenibacillus lycopersici]QHT62355.1 aldose 1-epimerase [Paenibacillus lycopersici]